MRILLVDDDECFTEVLTQHLTAQHYAVDTVSDGQLAWEHLFAFDYDLMVLDIMLPKLDGISLCRQLRTQGYQLPILLLTALDNSTDAIQGLDAGADDYVVKPADVEVLIARIRALLRRDNLIQTPILRWQDLSLDPSRTQAIYREQPLPLTPKQFALLELFLRHPNRVFSLSAVLDNLWSAAECPGEETVRTHMKGLRQKLVAVGAPRDLITTVYGVGYRLKDLPDEVPKTDPKLQDIIKEHTVASAPSQSNPLQSNPSQDMLDVLVHTWQQYKDSLLQRSAVLEQVSQCLSTGPLGDSLRERAEREAHSLTGTLGTFGLVEGSRLARALLELLRQPDPLAPEQIRHFGELVTALLKEMEQGTPSVEGGGDSESTDIQPNAEESVARQSSLSNASRHRPHAQPQHTPHSVLLAIAEDSEFTQQVIDAAAIQGIQGVRVSSLAQTRDWLATGQPHVVLVQLSATSAAAITRVDALQLIEELAHQTPTIPVLVMTDPGHWTERLDAVQRGARLCLEQPITPEDVIQVLHQVLRPSNVAAKVMVVDDDSQLLESLHHLLKPWAFQLTTLEGTQRFWQVLQEVNPDLLVLDIEMPKINGIELCQLIRSDPKWHLLPIVFLSARSDVKIQHQLFASGADDYVTKPVVPAELATRILNRLERVKLIRNSGASATP